MGVSDGDRKRQKKQARELINQPLAMVGFLRAGLIVAPIVLFGTWIGRGWSLGEAPPMPQVASGDEMTVIADPSADAMFHANPRAGGVPAVRLTGGPAGTQAQMTTSDLPLSELRAALDTQYERNGWQRDPELAKAMAPADPSTEVRVYSKSGDWRLVLISPPLDDRAGHRAVTVVEGSLRAAVP